MWQVMRGDRLPVVATCQVLLKPRCEHGGGTIKFYALALACAAVLANDAAAQDMTEKQVEAVITKGEKLLAAGQPKQALQATSKLTTMLLAEGALNYPNYAQLWDRAIVLSATAVVRLNGNDPARPDAEPKQNLNEAEQRFRELLAVTSKPAPADAKSCKCSSGSSAGADKPAPWKSRHGEALVALGRYQEAFDLLVTMLPAATLSEAEGAAALARAAHELAQVEVAAAAEARCKTVAKQRAKQLCRGAAKAGDEPSR